jgi:hypothetical protein
MKKTILSLLLIAVSTTTFAQLKVTSAGNVYVQKSYTDTNSSFSVGDFPNNYGIYNSGYKIGVHAKKYDTTSSNDCVGILGESKRGTNSGNYFSVGVWGYSEHAAGNRNIGVFGTIHPSQYGAGICGSTEGYPVLPTTGYYAGYFYGNTYVDGTLTATNVINSSDIRLKENVTYLSASAKSRDETLGNVMNMNVIKYNFKDKPVENSDAARVQTKRTSEKKQLHYGLSAQELRELYPDLVYEGQDGYLGINYIELVPILIRSIQELKQELDELKGAGGEDGVRQSRSAATAVQATNASTGNVLYQNTPNPFKEKTTIRFRLADDAQNAAICIFDLSGKLVKKLLVSSGDESVTVPGYELGEGMFLYTLMVNGQEIDTKRMIISK